MGIRKLRKEIAVAAMNRPPPRQTTSAMLMAMLSKSPLAPSRNAAEEAGNTRAIAARVHSPQANALENIVSSQESTSRSPGGSEDTERRSAPPRPSLRPLPSVPSVAATEWTEQYSDEHSRAYWTNASGKSSWTLPRSSGANNSDKESGSFDNPLVDTKSELCVPMTSPTLSFDELSRDAPDDVDGEDFKIWVTALLHKLDLDEDGVISKTEAMAMVWITGRVLQQ